MEVNQRIFHLLQTHGKTASELAKFIGISGASVSAWKNEGSYPSSKYLKQISEFLSVTPDFLILGKENLPPTLRGDEKRLLRIYNQLNPSGRRLLMLSAFRRLKKEEEEAEWWETHQDSVVELMEKSFGPNWRDLPENGGDAGQPIPWEDTMDDFERDDAPFPEQRTIAVYQQSASAGNGTFLDSDRYDLVDFPIDIIPTQASFGVRVAGDSMTPDYHGGDVLFVKQQPTLLNGELGVFVFNGEAFFKKYVVRDDLIFLVSLNPSYKPMVVEDYDELRVVGKVIGRYEEHPLDMELANMDAPPSMDRFTEWFDARARAANEGIVPDELGDADVVKPGDPEYDKHIPWAASGGAHLDPEKDKRMQDRLRLFEKRARLASEEPGPEEREKKNKDGE